MINNYPSVGKYLPKFFSANIYLFKVKNGNPRKIYESCSKLTVKTPERRQWRRSGVFVFNFEQILHNVPMFASLTLNKWIPAGSNLQLHKRYTLANQLTFWAKKLYCNFWDWVLNTPLLNWVINEREHHSTKHLSH